ncbi:MAG: hypothetical protein R3Y63_01510 [Eubacteriales bacterium]
MKNSNEIGTLYMEYIEIKDKLKTYGKLMAFYWCLACLKIFPLWLAVAMGQILMILAPLGLFTEREEKEEGETWHRSTVKGRYQFAVALGTLATLVNLMILMVWEIFAPIHLGFFALITATVLAFFLLFLAVPLFYSMGIKKGKNWFFLFLLTGLSLFVINYNNITNSIQTFWTVPRFLWTILILMLEYFISWNLSLKFNK